MEPAFDLYTDVVDDEGFVGTIVALGLDGVEDQNGPHGVTYKIKNIHDERIVKEGVLSQLQSDGALRDEPAPLRRIAFTTTVRMTVHVNLTDGTVDNMRILMPMQINRQDFDPDEYDGDRTPTEFEMKLAEEVIDEGEWKPLTSNAVDFQS